MNEDEEDFLGFYSGRAVPAQVSRGWEPAGRQMVQEIEEFLAKEANGRG